jgi:hypothetical protein
MKKLKITWTKIVHFSTAVESDGRELHIDVSGGGDDWCAHGIEVTGPCDPEAVVEGRRHHTIGCFRSRDRAMREAEKYMRRWLRERARMMMPRPKAVSDVEPGFDDPPPSAADDLSVN